VCALSVIYADLWMVGQIYPGRDTVKFVYCTMENAAQLAEQQNQFFNEKSIIL